MLALPVYSKDLMNTWDSDDSSEGFLDTFLNDLKKHQAINEARAIMDAWQIGLHQQIVLQLLDALKRNWQTKGVRYIVMAFHAMGGCQNHRNSCCLLQDKVSFVDMFFQHIRNQSLLGMEGVIKAVICDTFEISLKSQMDVYLLEKERFMRPLFRGIFIDRDCAQAKIKRKLALDWGVNVDGVDKDSDLYRELMLKMIDYMRNNHRLDPRLQQCLKKVITLSSHVKHVEQAIFFVGENIEHRVLSAWPTVPMFEVLFKRNLEESFQKERMSFLLDTVRRILAGSVETSLGDLSIFDNGCWREVFARCYQYFDAYYGYDC